MKHQEKRPGFPAMMPGTFELTGVPNAPPTPREELATQKQFSWGNDDDDDDDDELSEKTKTKMTMNR